MIDLTFCARTCVGVYVDCIYRVRVCALTYAINIKVFRGILCIDINRTFPFNCVSLRHYTNPQHYNASKLTGLNYAGGETSYQSLSKERSDLSLHINQNHQHQQNQLHIQVQLQQHQQKQAAISPHQQQQQQQHQTLLSPELNFTGNGKPINSNTFYNFQLD